MTSFFARVCSISSNLHMCDSPHWGGFGIEKGAAWSLKGGSGRSWVQVPLRPRAGFVSGSPWFNSSAALGNSQLVCLLPVGILNLFNLFQYFVSFALKIPRRENSMKYTICTLNKQSTKLGICNRLIVILFQAFSRWILCYLSHNTKPNKAFGNGEMTEDCGIHTLG